MDIRTEGAHLDEWRETVTTAIEATRPADEIWSVTATEVADGVVTMDFARNTDAPGRSPWRCPAATPDACCCFGWRATCYGENREP
jgi:hypothetical protein